MKAVLLLIILSCSACFHMRMPESVPANSKKVAIKLIDTLGVITMYVPERYDTGFAWFRYSDCKPCHEMKCRFQSKLSKIEIDSMYFDRSQIDSADQLTIIYHPYDIPRLQGRHIDTTGMYQLKALSDDQKEAMKFWPREKQLILDTCYKIHDRPLYTVATREYDPELKRYTYLLTAESLVRMADIKFEFKLITNKQDSVSIHFVEDVAEILQTIRFSCPML